MLAAEEAIPEAIESVRHHLSLVDCNGCAVANSIVDAAPVGLRMTLHAFDRACNAYDVVNTTQAELQLAWDELRKADIAYAENECQMDHKGNIGPPSGAMSSCNHEQVRAEAAHELVQARVEQAQEHLSNCLEALLESGHAFSKSFRKAQAQKVALKRVTSIQESANVAFARLQASWQTTRALQEAWLKAHMSCREPVRNVAAAVTVSTSAAMQLAEAQAVMEEAAAEEALCRAKREAREAEALAAEAVKVKAEAFEVDWKRRRDELRAGLGAAHLETLKSRAAAQEAVDRRSALQAWCARTENLHLQLEASKFSAVDALKAEAYNAKQVEEAYVARKRHKYE